MSSSPRVLTAGLFLLAAIVVPPPVSGQQVIRGGLPPGGQAGGPPAGPGGATQGGPPRDARSPAQTGTGVIRGRVLAADTGRPLRRARINVTAPELGPQPVNTSTGADGRYEIKELPAGRYTVNVNRSGYLRLSYGQRRPFEQGKPLQIADKQVVENIDFALPRMSLITGRMFDETGDPISGVRIFAMRSVYFEGLRRMVPVAGGFNALTDDAGQYRILGLAPGTYFVMADMRETWNVTEGGVEQVLGYTPTYFPGTTNIEDARRITVGLGQEANNNDFALIPGRAANVSGTATDSRGRPLSGRPVGVGQQWRGPGFGMMMMGSDSAQTAADGTFRIKNLAPGEYTLRVQGTTEINGASVEESVSVPVVVSGVDLDNVALTSSAGWSIQGQIVSESGQPLTVPRERIRVIARPATGNRAFGSPPPGGLAFGADNGRIKEDWTFLAGAQGAVRLRATAPDSVAVKAIFQEGRDVTDNVFELRSGEILSGIQIVLSTRVTSVRGQLTDDKGAPLADGTILVFSNDAERWAEDSRFVRAARPDQQGQYEIRGLPAGDYLAIAVDYVEEGSWNDPDYLESLRRFAQRLTLNDGVAQTIALKLVMP